MILRFELAFMEELSFAADQNKVIIPIPLEPSEPCAPPPRALNPLSLDVLCIPAIQPVERTSLSQALPNPPRKPNNMSHSLKSGTCHPAGANPLGSFTAYQLYI